MNVSKWLKYLSLLGCTTLISGVELLGSQSAQAQTVVRPFTTRYQTRARGNINLIGNTLMTCDTNNTRIIGNDCPNVRNGSGTYRANNYFFMRYVDIDGNGSTFNSSSSRLTIPNGATIAWAGLYWSGDLSAGQRDTLTNVGGEVYNAGQPSPNPSLNGQALLQVPGNGYQQITANNIDQQGSRYSAFADVTSIVRAAGSGNYTMANVQAGTGGDRYAGWSLIVVYEDSNELLRSLNVFDGFAFVSPSGGGEGSVSTTVSGFETPANDTFEVELGAVVYEGDLQFAGDQFKVNGINLGDGLNPADNFFNSSNTRLNTRFTAKNPDYVNQLAIDINTVDATGTLGNNDTSALLEFTSLGDVYYPTALTFTTEIKQPILTQNFTKTAVDVNGGVTLPGDILEYEITLENTGNGTAVNTVISDPIPENTTLVDGSLEVIQDPNNSNIGTKTNAPNDDTAELSDSNTVLFRVGNGADATNGGNLAPGESVIVKFQVQIDPQLDSNSNISNQASVNFNNDLSGTAYSGVSDDPNTPEPEDATSTQTAVLVTVSGTVYEDFGAGGDNNNTFDSGEGTIGNVTVNLFEDNNNDNQPDGAAVQTVETDASTGAYQFTNVASGRYLIQVDTRDTNIPNAYAIGTPNPIQITISDADITDRDFGFNTVSKTCPAGSYLPEQTFLNFQNPVAEPGTAQGNYNVGAVYRFSNVTTDIDALVEITSLNNATLTQIDLNNFGLPSAFQPEVRANSTNSGEYSVDFDINFVQSGTNTPVELRRVLATGIDIDGDSGQVREASELGGNQFTNYVIDRNSRLSATELGNDRVKFESTTNFNLDNITVNPSNQGSVYYDNSTQSIQYRAGLIIDTGDGTNVANQRLTSLVFDCVSYDFAVTSEPNLLLVKRITAINPGQSDEVRFSNFVDDPNAVDDNAESWPDNDNTYLPGRISVIDIKPADEVEYTIYFLSNGGKAAEDVKICDVVPDNMSFVADSNNSNSGIAFLNSSAAGATPINLTNAADSDEGTFYAPGIAPPTVGNPSSNLCYKVNSEGNTISVGAAENINGAIVVEINSLPEATAPGTPFDSYGFIRFRAKVQ